MKLPSSIFLRATTALAASWLLAGCSGDSESTNSQDITATDVVTMDSGGEDLHSEDSASPSDISTQDTTIDAAAPDIAEPPWTFGPVDGEEALWVETLATLPTTWIAALGEARALAVADNKLWDINPTENMEIGIPEDFDLSQLVAATRTMAGTTIIQTQMPSILCSMGRS